MRTVRLLVPLAVAALGLLLPTAAMADPYPIGSPGLTVDFGTVVVGAGNHVHGSGFGPNDNVSLDIVVQANAAPAADHRMVPVAYTAAAHRAIIVIADINGEFDADLLHTEVGLAIITATGDPSGVRATIVVRVLPSGAALPVTGQSGTALRVALLGSAVAATGVVLLVLVRSRRRRAHHTES